MISNEYLMKPEMIAEVPGIVLVKVIPRVLIPDILKLIKAANEREHKDDNGFPIVCENEIKKIIMGMMELRTAIIQIPEPTFAFSDKYKKFYDNIIDMKNIIDKCLSKHLVYHKKVNEYLEMWNITFHSSDDPKQIKKDDTEI